MINSLKKEDKTDVTQISVGVLDWRITKEGKEERKERKKERKKEKRRIKKEISCFVILASSSLQSGTCVLFLLFVL